MLASDHSASLMIRRDADHVCWKSRLDSLEAILAPSQPLRTLDIVAVATSIYHGVAYDALATAPYAAPALQLHRREVAFNPSGDMDSYLLTVKITVRSCHAGAISTSSNRPRAVQRSPPSAPPLDDVDDMDRITSVDSVDIVDENVPFVDVSEEDVLLELTFKRMGSDVQLLDIDSIRQGTALAKPFVRCEAVGVAFANGCLNWRVDWTGSLMGSTSGASLKVYPLQDGLKFSRLGKYEITLQLQHVGHAQPLLFLLSAGGVMKEPLDIATHNGGSGELSCTVSRFQIDLAGPEVLRVQLLPGSAAVCETSVLTIREFVEVRD